MSVFFSVVTVYGIEVCVSMDSMDLLKFPTFFVSRRESVAPTSSKDSSDLKQKRIQLLSRISVKKNHALPCLDPPSLLRSTHLAIPPGAHTGFPLQQNSLVLLYLRTPFR